MMIPGLAAIAVGFVFVLWLMLDRRFLPASRGLRILMYHKVSEDRADKLTVRRDLLERQFEELANGHYNIVSFGELLDGMRAGAALPRRPAIITFDDGYSDTFTLVFPLLVRYNLKATVFLVSGRIGGVNDWDKTGEPLMDAGEIREMAASGLVEFGLHSHLHASYRNMSPAQMREDLSQCIGTLEDLQIPFVRVMCYPYGGFPRKTSEKAAMHAVFSELGVELATRIGGRINRLPIRKPYELERIGIEGPDELDKFRLKLKKGSRKLF